MHFSASRHMVTQVIGFAVLATSCRLGESLDSYTGGAGSVADSGKAVDASQDTDRAEDATEEDASNEAPQDVTQDQEADTVEETNPTLGLGEECVEDGNCYSGFCAEIRPDTKLCSEFCCSSFDCPASMICVPTNGSNLCVPASVLGVTPGSSGAGADCSESFECRSVSCLSGQCIEACCSTECECVLYSYVDVALWTCGLPSTGTLGAGEACSDDDDCQSGLCLMNTMEIQTTCAQACCSDDDCPDSNACAYYVYNESPVRTCVPGMIAFGAHPCCRDADCPAGQHCRLTFDDAIEFNASGIPTPTDAWAYRCE